MKKILFICFLSLSFIAKAGNENFPIGARSTGMGNTCLTLSDVWSTQYNQAGLANVRLISAGVSYESRFLQKDLGIQSFAFALPVKSGTFGLNYTGFGGKLYRQTKVGLSYGMKFSEKISGGISLNYHNLRIGNNYGNKSSLTFEVGIIAQIIENLQLGVHIFNPSQTKLNDFEDEIIPTIFRLGVRYDFSDKVVALLEVEKDVDFNPSYKAGIEYHPTDLLYIRTGISTNPSAPSIGFGVDLNNFRFDFSSTFHPVLGATPAIGLVYTAGSSKKTAVVNPRAL